MQLRRNNPVSRKTRCVVHLRVHTHARTRTHTHTHTHTQSPTHPLTRSHSLSRRAVIVHCAGVLKQEFRAKLQEELKPFGSALLETAPSEGSGLEVSLHLSLSLSRARSLSLSRSRSRALSLTPRTAFAPVKQTEKRNKEQSPSTLLRVFQCICSSIDQIILYNR